ncbi:DUF6588 family protein [Abyssalbus ytuae]|uniref:Uncharacterized protein n=1 Tax=Abyssalbus ytuae TaxID=2926907 RepID=A0A9E6ZTQ7_9FLAO|nr:DUF6588 family protein [Abyssalbus ytuae]UOB16531.1 hypothetical protein MQE35_12380 [Abyssalbus ytuae]
MKKISIFLALLTLGLGFSQENINDIFAAGINDAQTFAEDYFAPATEGAMFSISNGWFNSADVKPLLGFEISFIGNITPVKDEKKSFILNVDDYENLQFADGSPSKAVSTALGDIEGVEVVIEGPLAGSVDDARFELPAGLASGGVDFIPTGFIQASLGVIKATELKVRFFPKIKTDDVKVGFYGFGVQHEFTKWLPADKVMPIAISGLIGYTHLDGSYDFTDTGIIEGDNQRVESKMNTWVFQAIASTKLPVINFYGSIGYMTGKSETDVLGTYVVSEGPFTSEVYVDPFSISNKANGARATLGTKLKLSFFRLNAEYTFAKFNNFNFGVSFGFR